MTSQWDRMVSVRIPEWLSDYSVGHADYDSISLWDYEPSKTIKHPTPGKCKVFWLRRFHSSCNSAWLRVSRSKCGASACACARYRNAPSANRAHTQYTYTVHTPSWFVMNHWYDSIVNSEYYCEFELWWIRLWNRLERKRNRTIPPWRVGNL